MFATMAKLKFLKILNYKDEYYEGLKTNAFLDIGQKIVIIIQNKQFYDSGSQEIILSKEL